MAEDAATDGLLERLKLLSGKPGENAELLRSLSGKLLTKVSNQDSTIRQATLDKLWNKNSTILLILVTLLENSRDVPTCCNAATILREALCLKPGKARKPGLKKSSSDISEDLPHTYSLKSCNVSKQNSSLELTGKDSLTKKFNNNPRHYAIAQLAKQNGSSIMIRALMQIHSRREPNNIHLETLTYDSLWVLNQMAQKDAKFPLKVRTYGGIKIFHALLKTHYTNNKVVFPLLSIMKLLTKSSCTSSVLIRDDIVATYEKILMLLGHAPTVRLRLCLDAIDYLSRNKVCSIQIVKAGIIILLLRIFDRWEKYEGKIRIKLATRILQTLQHVCITKSGRRTLASKKHIQIIYKFCTMSPEEECYDKLIAKGSSIICHCLNTRTLPVPLKNPASFDLSNIITEEWPIDQDEDQVELDFLNGSSSDEDDALDEEDPDKSESDSDIENALKAPEVPLNGFNNSFMFQTATRDLEDLKRYNQFFKEFGHLQKQLRLVKSISSKDIISDTAHGTFSTSDFTLIKHKHSNSSLSAFGSSSPSLFYEMQASSQKGKLKKAESLGNLQCNMKILQDLNMLQTVEEVYSTIASRVRSVIPFVKVAYPDLVGGDSLCIPEPQHEVDRFICRKKIILAVERAINPENIMNEVVYSLDQHCSNESYVNSERLLENNDVQKIAFKQYHIKRLDFESRFESGNLRKAIQIGPREYDLILMPDVNANKRHLWFYFEVSNMSNCGSYTFNVVNCEKADSQFNFGMKPVMYSVKEATLGRPGWVRVGSDICYYRNSYQYAKSKTPLKCYLTVTFTIDFPHCNDVCYVAYHYPYTYTQMMTKIWTWSQNLPQGIYFRLDTLCSSLNNNDIPLVTITAEDSIRNPIQSREVIFLTSRVHPGESNASWIMDGTLGSLLDNSVLSNNLRACYVFKIVPMLNVEGVINGCYRCGLTNEDLNRRWSKPSPVLHPDIFHTKGLLEYMGHALRKPAALYCDFHGHSRKKNVFLYGCSAAESWCRADRDKAANEDRCNFMVLPALMHRLCGAFSLASCSFRVEREREATARVTVWRQLRVTRSYTLEASFCGFDTGPYKGLQVNTQHLRKVGKELCAALSALAEDIPPEVKVLIEQRGNNDEEREDFGSDLSQ